MIIENLITAWPVFKIMAAGLIGLVALCSVGVLVWEVVDLIRKEA